MIANSLGGAIARGWLTLAQSKTTAATLRSVDSVIFLQAAHQGSWVAGTGELLDQGLGLLAPLDEFILRQVAAKLNFDPQRPGIIDVAPQSDWYDSVNPADVPKHLHYYNFFTDIQPTVQANYLFGKVTLAQGHLGDLVMLPGTPVPTDEPLTGGAQFLPGGQQTTDRHQYAIVRPVFLDQKDAFGPGLAVEVLRILDEAANHLNFGDHPNDGKVKVTSCAGGAPVTPTVEVLRLLSNPAQGCS